MKSHVISILEPAVSRLFLQYADVAEVEIFNLPGGDVAVYGNARVIESTLLKIKETLINRKAAAKNADAGTLFFYSDSIASSDRAIEHLHTVKKLNSVA